MKLKYILIAVIGLLCTLMLWSQGSVNESLGEVSPDSTVVPIADSLLSSSAKPDSLFYSADNVSYYYTEEQIILSGNTSIRYQDSTISSDSLRIDLKKDRAFTYGVTVMQDGDQVLIGKEVSYDVATQTGMISDGLSRMDKGFYYGQQIRKVDKDAYDVDNGRFTTCDDLEPAFWFWARQMRMYRGDKVVGKPVVMYVNHFPVFYFPFMTFSLKRGRHPGFLMPEPSYNSYDGKLVRNIAYYYPFGDYADLTAAFDIMEKTGWRSSLSGQYTRRYEFNGSFNTAYQRRIQGSTINNDYSIRANHHHDLGDKSAVDVNIDYVSSKRIWESSDDINQSLAQQVTSSASYRKPIGSSYLNVGSTYTQDLQNDRINLTLPTASFRLASRPLYEFFLNPETTPRDSWWTNFNTNYFIQLTHTGLVTAKDYSFSDLIWDNTLDPADTTNTRYLNQHNIGLKHTAGLSYNWKLRGWLNFAHGVSYQESWFDRDKNGDKWVRGNYYSASSSANFNIYGVRNFENSRIKSIRHLITPSLGFSYAPDFSENSDFYSFGGIGLPSGKRSRNLNMSLGQKWQLKYLDKDGKTEKRISELFSLSSGASVNLEKEDKKVSNISHRLSFNPSEYSLDELRFGKSAYRVSNIRMAYNSDISTVQDPYRVKLLDPYLRSFYYSHSLRLSGSFPYKDYFPRQKNTLFNAYLPADSLQQRSEELTNTTRTDESWSLSISQDLSGPKSPFEPVSNNLRMSSSLKITTNWSLRYSNYYNLKTSELLSQSFDLSRDLHCWKIDISYTRRNEYWDYRIIFFNTTLPDALRFQTRDNKRY